MLPHMYFSAEASRRLLTLQRKTHDAGVWSFIEDASQPTNPSGVACKDDELAVVIAHDLEKIYNQLFIEAARDVVAAAAWPPWGA